MSCPVAFLSIPSGEAILDIGATQDLIGSAALQALTDRLRESGLQPVEVDVPASTPSGIGGMASVEKVVLIPVSLGGQPGIVEFTVLKNDIPPLLSVGLLEHLRASIDLEKNQVNFRSIGVQVPLNRLSSGHRTVPLVQWPGGSFPVPDEVLSKYQIHSGAFDLPCGVPSAYTKECSDPRVPRAKHVRFDHDLVVEDDGTPGPDRSTHEPNHDFSHGDFAPHVSEPSSSDTSSFHVEQAPMISLKSSSTSATFGSANTHSSMSDFANSISQFDTVPSWDSHGRDSPEYGLTSTCGPMEAPHVPGSQPHHVPAACDSRDQHQECQVREASLSGAIGGAGIMSSSCQSSDAPRKSVCELDSLRRVRQSIELSDQEVQSEGQSFPHQSPGSKIINGSENAGDDALDDEWGRRNPCAGHGAGSEQPSKLSSSDDGQFFQREQRANEHLHAQCDDRLVPAKSTCRPDDGIRDQHTSRACVGTGSYAADDARVPVQSTCQPGTDPTGGVSGSHSGLGERDPGDGAPSRSRCRVRGVSWPAHFLLLATAASGSVLENHQWSSELSSFMVSKGFDDQSCILRSLPHALSHDLPPHVTVCPRHVQATSHVLPDHDRVCPPVDLEVCHGDHSEVPDGCAVCHHACLYQGDPVVSAAHVNECHEDCVCHDHDSSQGHGCCHEHDVVVDGNISDTLQVLHLPALQPGDPSIVWEATTYEDPLWGSPQWGDRTSQLSLPMGTTRWIHHGTVSGMPSLAALEKATGAAALWKRTTDVSSGELIQNQPIINSKAVTSSPLVPDDEADRAVVMECWLFPRTLSSMFHWADGLHDFLGFDENLQLSTSGPFWAIKSHHLHNMHTETDGREFSNDRVRSDLARCGVSFLQLASHGPHMRAASKRHSVDFAELFSPPRIAPRAQQAGLRAAQQVFDLEAGWDVRNAADRQAFRHFQRESNPRFLMESPDCKLYSQMMNVNWARMSSEDIMRLTSEGSLMWNFALESAERQDDQHSMFGLEHPSEASSWKTPRAQRLLRRPGVALITFDMCQLGLSVVDSGELSRKRQDCYE